MSIPAEHLSLFKTDWIGDPNSLKALARRYKYNDLFTAELAAWCAEVHEHIHDLEDTVGVELLLMGGNAASLRFDAIQQRGSRDNDYLTAASHADIGRLMDAFAERFNALHPLFKPEVYEPQNPTSELNMITYLVPVALLLDHGKATNNTVKVEFHFEPDLPPAETVSGNVGPTQRTIRARLPELPYQFVLKLMTLAAPPVGIDEERRGDAIPASYTTSTSCSRASPTPASGRRWSPTALRATRANARPGRSTSPLESPPRGFATVCSAGPRAATAHLGAGGRSARYSSRNCASRFTASRGAGVPAACG